MARQNCSKDPRSTERWRQVREMCYRRDRKRNAKCWICGGTINYRASNNSLSPDYSPNAWEGDHRISVLQHPEFAFDPTNVMPSHCSCNRSRGDKEKEAGQLGENSRDWKI